MKKNKQFYNKIITYINKKENFGKVLLGILVLIFLVFTAIYLLGTGNISKIEEDKIINQSKKYINIVDDITESKSKSLDKYIIFALDYSVNNNGTYELSVKKIKKFIKTNFNKKVSEDDIISVGITEDMLNKNITYDSGTKIYKIENKKIDGKKIEKHEIYYYKVRKVRRRNKNTYVIKYDRYVINDPYKMLNYYIDNNIDAKTNEFVDTEIIRSYLMGTTTVSSLKSFISEHESDLNKYSKRKGKLKITYTMKGNKIYIYKIKR